ncbi:unnamed protein product [Effrenium voratum]|nr:unnamed protein product [Effrenium voratum]CAJ1460355.1 unnamed protein product [Effrenium voratum]
MGKKKDAAEEPKKEVPATNETKEDEDEPQIIKDLKQIDDEYLKIEREYEKKVQELQKEFTEKQLPFLEKRTEFLCDAAKAAPDAKDGTGKGTPALSGFWTKAMKHLPALEDHIEEWDEEVLDYCKDVTKDWLDESDLAKGFKLAFHFVENPFFTNAVLEKEYHLEEASPYTGEVSAKEVKASKIEWKVGKDVTVEKVTKKVKGGGAKKAKQKGKEKEEPRDSFFRNCFRNLKQGGPIPDDVNLEEARELVDEDDSDDEQMMELLLENDYEIGCCVRDQLIPYAVRWYTGEAVPEDHGFDEDDEEEDDEEDEDDDDDEDSEDEEPPKGKKGYKPPARGKAGKSGGEAFGR